MDIPIRIKHTQKKKKKRRKKKKKKKHDTHMKFTNLSTLLNPKPPPTPKFDMHTQSGIIPILNGQNSTWVSIRMNKL